MKLDLVIATHNRAGLLKHCLNSVFQALVPKDLDVRVLVVDNNSTDSTKEVVLSFSGRSLPIDYLFVGRPGKSAALNDGIPHTDGNLIGLIDDDEEIDFNWFQVVYREFSGNESLGFIGGPYLANFEHKPPEWVPDLYNGALGVAVRADNNKANYERRQFSQGSPKMLMGGNAVIRRSDLLKAMPYPESLGKIGDKIRSGEDEVIYYRLLEAGVYGMFVPELVIHHWVPSSRMTKTYYRKWVVGRGIAMGAQLRERGSDVAKLFGVPRYRFRVAAASLVGLIDSRSRRAQFTAQLHILDALAVLYGFHHTEEESN